MGTSWSPSVPGLCCNRNTSFLSCWCLQIGLSQQAAVQEVWTDFQVGIRHQCQKQKELLGERQLCYSEEKFSKGNLRAQGTRREMERSLFPFRDTWGFFLFSLVVLRQINHDFFLYFSNSHQAQSLNC